MNIQEVITSFKDHQLQYGLHCDPVQDELYKWKLISKQIDRPNTDAVDFSQEIMTLDLGNLCYSTQVTAYRNFAKYEPEEYRKAMSALLNESIDLQQRVESFITTCKNLWDDKIKKKFDNSTSAMCDERLISCFLTIKYPQKYTFYKNDVYASLCKILGVDKKKPGQKLVHFYELLNNIVIPAINSDKELIYSISEEIAQNGYIQSDCLNAQTVLWYNLCEEKKTVHSNKFRDKLIDEARRRGYDIGKKGTDFIWLGVTKDGTAPSFDLHYELSFDGRRSNTSALGHDKKHCFAEIHLENKATRKELGNELLQKMPSDVQSIEWEKGVPNSGFRMVDSGVHIDDENAVDTALNDLDRLYSSTCDAFIEVNGILNSRKEKINTLMKEIDILTQKKQIILQGAPGTGKTYKTAAMAVALCDGINSLPSDRDSLMSRYRELVSEKRIAFTTFHQSMDYEEFVEGIKPNTEDGKVSYEVNNGIFREICNEAVKAQRVEANDNFETVWVKLMSYLDDNDYIDVKLLNGKGTFRVELNELGTGLANRTYPDNNYSKGNWLDGKSKFFNKEQLYNIYRGLPGTPAGGHDNYRRAIVNHLKKEFGLVEYKEGANSNGNVKNYVLVIDEINRANISKVLGELITLLEADKRLGEINEVKVTLPYSKEDFGVPANLYIIGTMNTADRSVGYIDYAIRRRFAFITIKAERNVIETFNSSTSTLALQYFDKVKAWMSYDNVIGDVDADDLMVGHSYFLADSIDSLKTKMLYEVIPLLLEYINDGILNAEIKQEIKDWEEELG